MKLKKLTALFAAGALALTLAACSTGGGTVTKALAKAEDVYGMGAVTTVQLMQSSFSANAVRALESVSIFDENGTDGKGVDNDTKTGATEQATVGEPEKGNAVTGGETADDEEVTDGETGSQPAGGEAGGGNENTETAKPDDTVVAQFHKYFEMLDGMLGDEIISTTVGENTDSDYADYAVKMEIKGSDLDGKAVTHTMYYNETEVEAGVDDDEDETESEFNLEGVLVMDGKDYAMRGERKSESEKDESEQEIFVRAYPDITDESTYVEVKQETETEQGETEREYVYRVFSAGRLLEETAVSFESEEKEGKSQTEIEVEFRKGEGKGRYSIEKEIKNGKTEIEVKYDVDGKRGSFEIKRVVNADGKTVYQYEFDNGEELEFDDED